MPRLDSLLTLAVLAFVGVRLVGGLRTARTSNGRRAAGEIVRGVRWRHVWPVPLVLAAVIAAATLLMWIPGLDWGWWTWLGGDGNPVFGTSDATAGTVLEWLVPLVFVCLLVPALPLFAHAEERMFRLGAEHWSTPKRVAKAVQFGLVHALIGIPLGAALALSVGGGYFTLVYLRTWRRTGSSRASVLESTRAHTCYNAIIIVLVTIGIVVDAVA
ncbi:MAG: hypothetical protein RI900_3345 [Actinomycetota bacterium]